MPRPVRVVRRALRLYRDRNCWLLAGSIAFFAFLSLMPLLFLAVVVAARVLGTPTEATATVTTYIQDFIPEYGELVLPHLRVAIEQSGAIGVLALVALAWTVSGVFNALQAALRATWGLKPMRGWQRRVLALGMFAAITVLLLASVALTAGLEVVQRLLPDWSVVTWAFGRTVSFLVSATMFLLSYYTVFQARIPFRARLLGAVVAGLLFEVAKWLFAWYASTVPVANPIYGGMATVVVLLLWVYYSASILLLGATLVYAATDSTAGGSP